MASRVSQLFRRHASWVRRSIRAVNQLHDAVKGHSERENKPSTRYLQCCCAEPPYSALCTYHKKNFTYSAFLPRIRGRLP